MKHVFVKSHRTLYSFAPHSLVTITNIDLPRRNEGIVYVEKNPIFYAGIALTNLCNLDCKHCAVNTVRQKEKVLDFSQGEMKRLIADLARQGLARVSVTGGEPFAFPRLKQFFEILREHEIEPKINTNGTIVDLDLVEELIKLGLDEIDVSMNHPYDDSDTYYDGKNRANIRLNTIKNLAKRFKGQVTITVSSVLTRRVIENLKVFEKVVSDSGADRWRLRELMPSDARSIPIPDEVYPEPSFLAEQLADFANAPRKIYVYGYLFEAFESGKIEYRCANLERFYLYIDFRKDVYWMHGLTNAKVGRYNGHNMPEIAHGITQLYDTMSIPKRCEKCPARYVCFISPSCHSRLREKIQAMHPQISFSLSA